MTRDHTLVPYKPQAPVRPPSALPFSVAGLPCPGLSAPRYFRGPLVAGATLPFLEYLSPLLWLAGLGFKVQSRTSSFHMFLLLALLVPETSRCDPRA